MAVTHSELAHSAMTTPDHLAGGAADAPTPASTANDTEAEPPELEPTPSRFRLIWLAIGWFFFGIGFIGIFVVVLPTTGFWILAAIAFERSNPVIAQRIRNWPHFGPIISAFLDHGVISKRGKIAAISAMGLCALLLVATLHGVPLWAGLGGIAVGALYVGTRPSAPR